MHFVVKRFQVENEAQINRALLVVNRFSVARLVSCIGIRLCSSFTAPD